MDWKSELWFWDTFVQNTITSIKVSSQGIQSLFPRSRLGKADLFPSFPHSLLDSLIEDIETDKRVGIASLERSAYQAYSRDPFLGR